MIKHSTSEECREKAKKAVAVLRATGKKVATAESCTGGLLSAYITSVSGASAVFETGIAAYSAAAKQKMLSVSPDTIREYGTVSRKTAGEMAYGVRRKANADIGLAVTGVAGPEPCEGKSVGTVYIALADDRQVSVTKLMIESSDRDQIRNTACSALLSMLIEYFERG